MSDRCEYCGATALFRKYGQDWCSTECANFHNGMEEGWAWCAAIIGMAEAIRAREKEKRREAALAWAKSGPDDGELLAWSGFDDDAVCAACGVQMELVRPGKFQPNCDCWNQ